MWGYFRLPDVTRSQRVSPASPHARQSRENNNLSVLLPKEVSENLVMKDQCELLWTVQLLAAFAKVWLYFIGCSSVSIILTDTQLVSCPKSLVFECVNSLLAKLIFTSNKRCLWG